MAAAARAAMVMAAAMAASGRRRWQGWRQWRRPRTHSLVWYAAAIGGERADDGHGAEDGGLHEQHAHAELDQGLILVADLRWK